MSIRKPKPCCLKDPTYNAIIFKAGNLFYCFKIIGIKKLNDLLRVQGLKRNQYLLFTPKSGGI
ncbi:MAG: hypothetical protein ACJART_000680 [Maribacter sp.]|jgi:hypothetical protein